MITSGFKSFRRLLWRLGGFLFWPLLMQPVRAAEEPASAREATAIGYVFESSGEWLQNGRKIPTARGYRVFAHGTITLNPKCPEAQNKNAWIIITLYNGQRLERAPSDFAKPIELPESLGVEASALGRLVKAIGQLFAKESERYVVVAVRPGDAMHLSEAVGRLTDDRLDLTPALKDVPSGQYLARLERIGENTKGSAAVRETVKIEWNRGASLSAPGMNPGLHRLTLLRTTDERPLASAFLLAVPAKNYSPVAAEFAEVRAASGAWGDAAAPTEVQSFHRAALGALAARLGHE